MQTIVRIVCVCSEWSECERPSSSFLHIIHISNVAFDGDIRRRHHSHYRFGCHGTYAKCMYGWIQVIRKDYDFLSLLEWTDNMNGERDSDDLFWTVAQRQCQQYLHHMVITIASPKSSIWVVGKCLTVLFDFNWNAANGTFLFWAPLHCLYCIYTLSNWSTLKQSNAFSQPSGAFPVLSIVSSFQTHADRNSKDYLKS